MVLKSAEMALAAVGVLALGGCRQVPTEISVKIPTERNPAVERPLTPAEIATAQAVAADTLYTIYSQNLFIGATPDQRFQDRPMVVVGEFSGVNRRASDRSYLELRTHDPDAFVYAEMAPQAEPLLTSLVPGRRVRLLCRCLGVLGGSPMLMDCRLPETHGVAASE